MKWFAFMMVLLLGAGALLLSVPARPDRQPAASGSPIAGAYDSSGAARLPASGQVRAGCSAAVVSRVESLRAAMKKGVAEETTLVLRELEEFITDHPDRRPELLERVRVDSDSGLAAELARLLLRTGGVGERRSITDLAWNWLLSDELPPRRLASLEVLRETRELTPDLVQALGRVSREDAVLEVRLTSIATLGAWMDQHPDRASLLAEELRCTMEASGDTAVRNQILAMFHRQSTRPPGTSAGLCQQAPGRTEP